MRPRLHLFALGGTVAMAATGRGGGVVPSLDATSLLGAVPALAEVADLEATSFRQVPGAHLRMDDLEALAAAIEAKARAGVHGVVVTQGTDTIEETAFALDRLVAAPVALVVTGAMRNPTVPGADGPANLIAAARVASLERARDVGCLVVLNDEIHAARFVRKAHTSRPDAFGSVGCGPLGWVIEDRAQILCTVPRLAPIARLDRPLPARIALITLGLDDDGALIRAALQDGFTGLVVAGLGGGHASVAAADAIEAAAKTVDVVLASRTGAGEVLRSTYAFSGGEIDLQRRGAVSSRSLDAYKSRVLLTLLQRHGSKVSIDEAFAAY